MSATRKIGSLEVSTVGLGCNNFGGRLDAAGTAAVVRAALEEGITFFDTADIYGDTASEELLGRGLGPRRPEVVVATKFGMRIDDRRRGARPDYARRALEDSLRRLGTDYIDLYQLHEPDPTTPIADTLGVMEDAVEAGKVREIGCSNFSVAQLVEARAAAGGRAHFVSAQNHYNLLHREPEHDGVLGYCESGGIALVPFYPLEMGLLSGKYTSSTPPAGTRVAGMDPERARTVLTEERLAEVERLAACAAGHGRSLLELSFAWLLAHGPVASVIAGAMTPQQVRANVAAGTAAPSEGSPEAKALLEEVDDALGIPLGGPSPGAWRGGAGADQAPMRRGKPAGSSSAGTGWENR